MTDATNASDLLIAAARARNAGDIEAEKRLLEQANRAMPGDPRILNAQGMIALRQRDWTQASQCFSAAITADPQAPELWMNLATAHRSAKDVEGERAALEGALAIERRHLMAQLRMAELHEQLGDSAAAATSWSNIVQIAQGLEDRPPAVDEILTRGQAYLAQHNKAIADALDNALQDQLEALGPAARRFRACVDHSLGRRPIYTNQCAGVHYPFLPADEFFDRAHFPWFETIEAKTDIIRREAQAMMSMNSEEIRPYVRMEPGSPQTKWSTLDGSLDWSACFLWEYGQRNDAVCALCPETAAVLASLPQTHIPGKAPSAFFSLLRPGAHIPPHTGVTNTRAIIHLPLDVPENCSFRVGGETRDWRVGEAFAFDDTIEHEAWNRSDKPRIILIFDVWNPYLTVEEQQLLQRFFDITVKAG